MLLPGRGPGDESARSIETSGETRDREADGEAGAAAACARARLAVLQSEAGEVYDDITGSDAELRLLAGRRVAAEKVLRHDASRHEAAARALAAHDQDRPGAATLIATRLRAADEWRAGREPLVAALDEVERELADSRAVVTAAKEAFAARVAVRAEAVTELRRLTAECAAVIEEIAALEAAARGGETAPDDARATLDDFQAAPGLGRAPARGTRF